MNPHRTGWRWLFLLAALEAGAAFVVLARIPRENAGYSLARLALLAVLGGFVVGSGYFGLRPPRAIDALARPMGILFCAIVTLASASALFLLRYLNPDTLAPIYGRLGVILWYVLIVGAQTSVFLLIARFGYHHDSLGHIRSILQPSGLAFGILLLIALLIATTRIGLTPDSAYWGEPGVPIMGWQLALAIIASSAILLLGLRVRNQSHLDRWLAAGLWLLAVAIWLSVPLSVMRNSFYAPMTPPTLQAFPNSDAGYYDSMAESLLIGYPYQGEIPARPLYIAVLSALHRVVGERYDLIVAGQTLLLAFIPVLLYLLGRNLHSRAAGVAAALIAIFRELTTLLVSSQTRVSNSKTLLVDLPTLLLISVACLMVVQWLQRRDSHRAAAAGGVFGLLLLLRTQAIVILPLILLLVILSYGVRTRAWVMPRSGIMKAETR